VSGVEVVVERVRKTFEEGRVVALDEISLRATAGEFVAVTGPSGCGKSTLLNLVGALDRPDSGEIRVGGRRLDELEDEDEYRAATVGFVFQLHDLVPVLSALENVQVPMLGRRARRERERRARELLEEVGLGRRAHARRRERVAAFEDRLYGFYERRRARFLPLVLCEAAFHLLGVAEAYLTIALISGAAPTLLSAFLLESAGRVINVVFKFVPLRAGVDELGTGQVARLLTFGETAGVTLAIVRKARTLFWMAIGVALLAARGVSLRDVATGAEPAPGAPLGEAQQKSGL
jgi:ABC-type iron transport system FetAB ATPase subunit